MTELSIIIVNYNVKQLLENCINSILISAKNYNFEVIVVDNNSFDDSAEYIKCKFNSYSNIKIIENKINLGFGKANNLGVKEAKGKYLLILNPDTILQEDTIEKCINFLDSDPKIGTLTCKLIMPNGKLDLACRRSFPSTSVAFFRLVGLSKLFPKSKIFGKYNLTYLDENSTYEVDAICGAFMLMKKDLYDKLNGFDEDYFMYGEDLDLCYRIRKSGYKIFYYSGTGIIHYKGESTRKSSLSYVNNFYGAMSVFVHKNLNTSYYFMNLLIAFLKLCKAGISSLKRFFKSFYPVFIDLVLIIAAMLLSIKLRFEFFPIEAYKLVIIIYSIVWVISLSLSGSYKRLNILSFIRPLNGILIGFFINSSFTYFFNEFAFSRVVIIRSVAYSYLFLFLWRFIFKLILYSSQKHLFYSQSNTLIIGKNEESERFVNKLKRKVDADYNILGYIAVNGNSSNEFVGNVNNLGEVIALHKIKNLIFAKSELSNQQILDLMWKLRSYNLNYKILSSDSELILGKSPIDKIDDIYLMQIEYNINKKINIFVKRVFDIVFGIFCIIFVYPFVYLYVKSFKNSSNNLKFYSKVLQIPLVLKGKYSFVGMATWDVSSGGRLSLGKKGLTGLVQINYYKNLTEEEINYYNNYYAKNQTLLLDLEIILKTLSLYLFRNKITS